MTATVSQIVARIERHLNTHPWDPANNIGCWFMWDGYPTNTVSHHAGHVYIGYDQAEPEDDGLQLTEDGTAAIISALRSTAEFEGWSQSRRAAAILSASGIERTTP